MAVPLQPGTAKRISPAGEECRVIEGPAVAGKHAPLLTASSALYLIRHRTNIPVARATFYRWLNNGRIFSCRLGQKLYVPMSVVEETVRKCRSGERL